jgi:quinoprotein glucose dehydrogenase
MTPDQQVLAVDGATGREMWRRVLPDTNLQPVRGLSYWSMGASGAWLVGAGGYLHALDPQTGASIAGFGDHGRVDLRLGLGRAPDKVALALTTPATIWKDLAIVGFRTAEAARRARRDPRL